MRKLLMLTCAVIGCAAAQQSVRSINWMNFSYPLVAAGTPAEIRWMSVANNAETIRLRNGKYVLPDCNDIRSCPLITFDSVDYGVLAGVESKVAAVVLTYHSGGTAGWQYVYLFSLKSDKPRILAWLRTGSRADQGLRQVLITGGDLVLSVNDPNKRQGDCCSAGSITTRYRWTGGAFPAIGQPVYKTDPPSFDCEKAVSPTELLICRDFELSFLDRQMAESYRTVLKGASRERKEIIQRQQANWLTEYSRACNASISDEERRDCIDQHLNDRLMTIWK